MATNGNDSSHYQENGHLNIDQGLQQNSHVPTLTEVILSAVSNETNFNFIQSKLYDYEQLNSRKFEEKDQVIDQLKQNLVNLTEKRFRALNNNTNKSEIDPNSLNNNLQFVLNEKDVKLNELIDQLDEKQKEIATLRLPQTQLLQHSNKGTITHTVMR